MTASLWEETSTLLRNRFGTADTPSSLHGPFRILYYYYTTAKFPRELSIYYATLWHYYCALEKLRCIYAGSLYNFCLQVPPVRVHLSPSDPANILQ